MVTAGLLSGSPASAQSELPTFRLEYTAEDSCPPAGELVGRLAARVGYSPVREGGTDLLEIRIEATSAGLAANLRWVDRAGAIVGERQLSGPAGRCDDLPEEQYRNTYYITLPSSYREETNGQSYLLIARPRAPPSSSTGSRSRARSSVSAVTRSSSSPSKAALTASRGRVSSAP